MDCFQQQAKKKGKGHQVGRLNALDRGEKSGARATPRRPNNYWKNRKKKNEGKSRSEGEKEYALTEPHLGKNWYSRREIGAIGKAKGKAAEKKKRKGLNPPFTECIIKPTARRLEE